MRKDTIAAILETLRYRGNTLRREDRQALAAIGDALQGDEENICKAILLTGKTLETSLEDARSGRPEREINGLQAGALERHGVSSQQSDYRKNRA